MLQPLPHIGNYGGRGRAERLAHRALRELFFVGCSGVNDSPLLHNVGGMTDGLNDYSHARAMTYP